MGRRPREQVPRRPNPITNMRPIRHPTPIVRQALQAATKSRRLCPNKTCTSPKIEDGICKNCGTIIQESNIVAEVQFGESSSGAAVVQGSFVSADQGTAKSLGPAFRRAGGMEDREKTVREGKRIMLGLAAEHKISESVMNSGLQIFKLAAMNNFIQGRRMDAVAAVCLYTACRKEKPCRVMLIDFADSCRVNVFKLGHCFKMLHEKISLSKDGIHPVLPEDLIYRFASKLDFGDKLTAVAEDAARLVKRLTMDWIVLGRRPSGVCGCALMMAAQMHNFRRTVSEIVPIVKVTASTIQKRLDEFRYTPTSDLTIEEFLANEFLESQHDPPSFYEKSQAFQSQKKGRKRKRPIELGEDEEDSESGDENGSKYLERGISEEERQTIASLTPELDALPPVEYLRDEEGFVIPPPRRPKEVPIDPALIAESDNPAALDALAAEHGDSEAEERTVRNWRQALRDNDAAPEDEAAAIEQEISEMIGDPNTMEHARAFANAEQRALVHVLIQNTINPPKNVPMTSNIGDSEFDDDPEVANCVLSIGEAALKEQIWLNANKDWVKAQQEKEFKKRLAAMGPPKATRKRVKKPRIGEGQTSVASSPADAAVDSLKRRAWSKRINYDAIRGLFEGPGSGTTSRVTSRANSTIASSVAGSDAGSDGESDAGSVASGSDSGRLSGRVLGQAPKFRARSTRAMSIASESVAGGSDASSVLSLYHNDVGNSLLETFEDDPDEDWKKAFEHNENEMDLGV